MFNMRSLFYKLLVFALPFVSAIFICSCSSVPKNPVSVIISQNIDDSDTLLILQLPVEKKQYFVLKLYGSVVKNESNENIMTVSNLYWFDNWKNGWTEILFNASGRLKISGKGSEVFYTIIEPVTLEFPEYARLRSKDTYVKDEKAVNYIRNRMDRMNSMLEFLHQQLDEKNIKYLASVDYNLFEPTIGCVLFPERYGYIPGYNLEYKHFGFKDKILRDGIFWNDSYTKSFFPDYMWEVRNTGTLYRDWESNLDLFYILYFWDNYFSKDKKGTLMRVKK